jgi:uncharacterized protein with PhoU and TrkA domain
MNQEKLANMLAQLKDISEIMIDLSYSALICGSEEIADRVMEMEETMDRLHIEFELAVVGLSATRPAKGLLGLIRLAMAAEQIADAATVMASIVKRGLKTHPVLQMAMQEAEETVVTAEIADDSVLGGKSLGDLGLEDDIGMRIIAVRREKEWSYNPKDSFVLSFGDLIIAKGYVEGREKLLSLARPILNNNQ